MQGLGRQSDTVENTSTSETSAIQTSDRIEQIERLGERLAQRILVSDRRQVGESEVRIQLRESVLQGGEIRLRQEHGQLVVSIQIPSTDLARQLSGQTDALQQTLANRLETQVRVEVQVVDVRNAGNDSNPGDGRSRNRRDPWEAHEDPGA
ncbi:type III secretion HpaP family protein [Allochromatium palmeri]|uniref:type III secretion HpaP family protein n=1 Tax=Allochromatium palmeri TaxID=231048 RepID=UPI0012D71957|nr:type III secretion HpaP family protein [Allochromatium palmeri]